MAVPTLILRWGDRDNVPKTIFLIQVFPKQSFSSVGCTSKDALSGNFISAVKTSKQRNGNTWEHFSIYGEGG